MKRILSFWMAVACFCGGEVLAQEKLEIEVTRFGIPRTIEVDRNIEVLNLRESGLTSITLPARLTRLANLYLSGNQLTNLILPNDLTYLWSLDLQNNRLARLTLPARLTRLTVLRLSENQLTNLTLPAGLTSLGWLYLGDNQLTNFTLLSGLTRLEHLNLSENQLTTITLPDRLPNLQWLWLSDNQLTSLSLPKDSSQESFGGSWGRAFNLILEIVNVPLRSLRIPARLEGKVLLYTNSSDSRGHFDTDSLPLLDITYYVPPVELEISWVGNDLEISWNDNGVLQIATGVDGPWHDVNLESPVKLQRHLISSIPAEFFRVRAE